MPLLATPLFNLPSTPMKGEAGEGHDSMAPACLSMSSTFGEGEALRQGVGCRAKSVDRPAAPSVWEESSSSMVEGRAGPSQRESEIE